MRARIQLSRIFEKTIAEFCNDIFACRCPNHLMLNYWWLKALKTVCVVGHNAQCRPINLVWTLVTWSSVKDAGHSPSRREFESHRGHLQATFSKFLSYYVCSRQLGLLPFAGRKMSSSLKITEWRSSVVDWGGGISVVLHRGSNCSLSRAMDGRIMRRGVISSCQSAATSEIIKRCWTRVCLV